MSEGIEVPAFAATPLRRDNLRAKVGSPTEAHARYTMSEGWCGRGDLNSYGIATASPSSWCVCQFRHFRVGFIGDYDLKVLLSVYGGSCEATTGAETLSKLYHGKLHLERRNEREGTKRV